MSITNALNTGVSGLIANSTRVGKISDNIANASTVGYKRGFADLVTQTTGGQGTSSGVRAVQGSEVANEGVLRTTTRSTDMAISGGGFFIVSKNPNDPVAANYMLTRAGAFSPDENGDLKNSAGYYLAGYPYGSDNTIGQVDRTQFDDLQTVNLNSGQMTGSASSEMDMAGNLPSQATGLAQPGDAFVSTGEFYSPLGAAQRLEFSWQPGVDPNQWTLTVNVEGGQPLGSVDVGFHDAGAFAGAPQAYANATNLAAAPAAFDFDPQTGIATITVDNGQQPQVLEVTIGAPDTFGGMTQFSGDYTAPEITADGAQTGTLVRTEIDEEGVLYGVFDNGNRKALYQIPVGEVTNPDGMLTAPGNAYQLTRSAGNLRISEAGAGTAGTIAANSLEGSNVEIAEELTDLIQTQRAYSSNAKIVTTVDEMLDETMRLKR
ncbi:flagellar hook protein FlgE [Mesobaculum littorinae]|uniref:Flagellar hook protein FlgE n=1 Tax=Mesobaculum littorinae TaxID=2486419 RepID=A0A438ADS8_9RHOB|nr:flagellar hook protein FlgE [Mesobaculum littorinae]RVV96863.1 flagellar hook protein FlgE [Mesobaculum littorinae]